MNATHTNSVLRERGQQVSKDRQQLARIPPHIDTTIRLNSRSARISDGNDDDLAGIVFVLKDADDDARCGAS